MPAVAHPSRAADLATVGPPERFWRVSSWHDVFDPPSPASPVDDACENDDAHRWDDPEGRYRTLYCASQPEGALGECLGDFALNAEAVRDIDAFLEGEADVRFDEDFNTGLTEADVDGFQWQLADRAPLPGSRFIDIDAPRTYVAIARQAAPVLVRYGLKRFDRRALLDERRNLTRQLAGILRARVTGPDGSLIADGLRFTSRLPPAWESWALWEPLPLATGNVSAEPVTIHTPALRKAASLLGVALLG